MKTTTFTLTAMGLGLMFGLTLMHHYQVQEMVAQRAVGMYQAPRTAPQDESQLTQASVSKGVGVPEEIEPNEPEKEAGADRSQREDVLLELLAEMRKEQQRMHQQMAEQNRELAELTFRVDTHSDSFKPLQVDRARPRELRTSNGSSISSGDSDSLLPPKPSEVRRP